MKLANEFEIPVWPFFKSRNVGYGGAAPRVPGSLGIAMGKNMDRVLEIDTENVYALLEPGVSYLDLHEYLVKHNFRCKPPHEQEPNENWQLFDYSLGRHSAGIFSQSSLGFVVKMGIWLMPNPGGYQAYMITFPRDKDLDQIVEIPRPLRISGVIQNTPKLENVLVSAALQSHCSEYTNSNKPVTDLELDEIAKTLNVGCWDLYGAMYGPLVISNALWSVIKACFSKIRGAKFYFPEDRPSDIVLQTQYNLTRHLSEEYGFDFIGVFVVGTREMHHIVRILFDRKDPDSRHRAYKLIQVLIAEAADRNWGEYRAHLASMDQIAEIYSFNKNAQMKLNEKLKNTLDPKGILCPGKNGIWPANNQKEDWCLHKP
ncbi:FAD-linked oxidase-like protein [Aspergillus arachidicola]|uniref:FAD-linked oxidase-like protein n=1 Tax=Aspergillus arachidicola TaxID=656916 RepID=A0A5N6YLJ0_9EURO|nr:FAD-linked oxidase-like protein [Aspergillus arachidicola]